MYYTLTKNVKTLKQMESTIRQYCKGKVFNWFAVLLENRTGRGELFHFNAIHLSKGYPQNHFNLTYVIQSRGNFGEDPVTEYWEMSVIQKQKGHGCLSVKRNILLEDTFESQSVFWILNFLFKIILIIHLTKQFLSQQFKSQQESDKKLLIKALTWSEIWP